MLIRPSATGSQNRLDPQCLQNPRRALSDDWNHASPSDLINRNRSKGTDVAAQKWPDVLRHCVQWHAITSRNGASAL
jgi:hypothetical protein